MGLVYSGLPERDTPRNNRLHSARAPDDKKATRFWEKWVRSPSDTDNELSYAEKIILATQNIAVKGEGLNRQI